MSMRLMIGCVQMLAQPGIRTTLSISFNRSSLDFCQRNRCGDQAASSSARSD